MQIRERKVRRASGGLTTGERSGLSAIAFATSLGLFAALPVSPAKADFVCNAKTKLVNVFLKPPSMQTPQEVDPERELRRGLPKREVWSPADLMKEPFDIIDTLPTGARVKVHGSAEGKGWVWISFRHSQNGLVGMGYVHLSRLSAIKCDADPKLETALIEKRQYGIEDGDYFETGPDDPPLEGARGAKQFETSMISGAIRNSRVYVQCETPKGDHKHPDDLNPYIQTCTELLASNPNFVEALITRGDLYHRIAKSPAPGLDSKSPKWPEDIGRRKEAQVKAVADWTRASLLLPKGIPTVLEDRLSPSGPAGYAVK